MPIARTSPVLALLALAACGDVQEPPRVELVVFADAEGLAAVDTDLGYRVELSEARVVIDDLLFSVAGEAHEATWLRRLSRLLVPTAQAHPGHFQGGEVTGELRGEFIAEWAPAGDAELGSATLLAGAYHSVSFTFARGTKANVTPEDDILLGHTASLVGIATKDDVAIAFRALLDSPVGRDLTGVPFDETVDETTDARLGLQFLPGDPLEGDTLFDGLDFATLDTDANGAVQLEANAQDAALQTAYNRLLRTFQTHDHFAARLVEPRD